ncbi:MAG TPA: hypothetical protein VMU08_08495 [Rhizomicrobium sp.]|nr:hypothetical protein [Rhizomicrobium sp.]
MMLSDLASIGSFVSGVAVLISLIYLALQVRQAERNQRAALTQGYVNRAVDATCWFVENGIVDAMGRVMSGETEFTHDELNRLTAALRVIVLNAQDTYLAHAAGLVDQSIFDTAMIQLRSYLAQPVMRALWVISARAFAPAFREEIEHMLPEIPLAAPLSDRKGRFQATLASVMETR